MIWEENIEEIDTFEAFYKNVIHRNNILIFPYINIGVSNHPINPSKDQLYISKAYLIFMNACINKVNGIVEMGCDKFIGKIFKQIDISGIELEKDKHIAQKIFYERAFLQTIPLSQMRKEFWIPARQPNFEANMDEMDVQEFFNHKYLPNNIKDLIL
jgi:hypothetical protein